MRIDEIITTHALNEDAREASEINQVARYLENSYLKFKDKIGPTVTLSLHDLDNYITKRTMPLPTIISPVLKSLLIDPGEGREPLEFGFNHAWMSKDKERSYGTFLRSDKKPKILINSDLLQQHKKSIASTIAHEIQHAVDMIKSSGKAFKTTDLKTTASGEIDYDDYLKQSDEINARFAQALMDIAESHPSIEKSQAPAIITQSLAAHKLTKAIVGERGYKRLLSRSYKFVDEMNMIAAQRKKPGFREKIKGIIKRLLS
jgi:hypothetical protein